MPASDTASQREAHDNNVQHSIDSEAQHAVHALDTRNVRHLSEFKRFLSLTAASFAMICASTSYAFNLFSGVLQSKHDYDSRAMSTINSVGMVFAYFLTPYGFICDYFGPMPIYVIAITYFCLGSLLMGLSFQNVINGSVVKYCVFNALLSSGSQLFDLATMTAILSVFPTRRGWCICILKTLMGLGSSILAAIWVGFFTGSPSYYFYFLVGLVAVVGTAVLTLVRLPSYHFTGYEQSHLSDEEKEKRSVDRVAYLTQEPPMFRFYYGVLIICILVVYLPVMVALAAFLDWKEKQSMIVAIIAIIITAFLLLIMMPWGPLDRMTTKRTDIVAVRDEDEMDSNEPIRGQNLDGTDALQDELSGDDGIVAPTKEKADETELRMVATGDVKTDVDYVAPAYQTTFLQSLCTIKFWCIFWTMFCGLGCEFVIIFNARFIYAALDGAAADETVATLLTVLNGAGSAIGRMAMSVFEMKTQNRPAEKRIPITTAMFVPTFFIIVSVILFLVLPGRSMLVAFAIASLGNGFCASITILVARTIYAKDPAKHYNFGINALVPAAILINRLLYGEWYAVQAAKEGTKICLVRRCVQMPMIVMVCLQVTAFLSTLYLHIQYVIFCRSVMAERSRIKEEGMAGLVMAGEEDDSNEEELVQGAQAPHQ